MLTLSHLIYGQRIKSLVDEIMEPDDVVSEAQCPERFKYLSTRLDHFWNLSRPVQKLYPLEIKSQGEGDAERSVQAVENCTRTVPRRNAAPDSQWKSHLMLDSR